MRRSLYLLAVLLAFPAVPALAQAPPPPAGGILGESTLGGWVLAFATIITFALIYIRIRGSIATPVFVQLAVLTIAGGLGICLLTSGVRQEAMTAGIGLLGTLAGYVLGRGNKPGDEKT